MEALPPPRPVVDLATELYYQLVCTPTDLFRLPLGDSPEALRARNHSAIAKGAALLPVNANEIDPEGGGPGRRTAAGGGDRSGVGRGTGRGAGSWLGPENCGKCLKKCDKFPGHGF
jgi:hypothetical protein